MLKSKQQESAVSNRQPATSSRQTFVCLMVAVYCLLIGAACRVDMQDQPRYKAYRASTFFKDGLSSRPLVEGTIARGYLKDDVLLNTGKIDRSQSNSNAGSTTTGQNTNGRMSGDDAAPQEGQSVTPQGARDAQGANNSGNTTQASGASRGGGGTGAQAAQGDPNDAATFPFPVSAEIVNRGQERYKIYCAMCHGLTGYGDGMIVRRGFRKPPSYHTDELRNARVGHIFDVITNGWGSMPSYNAQIPVRDRWAIIAYIRALQLSQAGVAATHDNAAAPNSGAQLPNTGGPK